MKAFIFRYYRAHFITAKIQAMSNEIYTSERLCFSDFSKMLPNVSRLTDRGGIRREFSLPNVNLLKKRIFTTYRKPAMAVSRC